MLFENFIFPPKVMRIFGSLCVAVGVWAGAATQANADIKWVLPKAIQSQAEQAQNAPRAEWNAPVKPPFVRDAAGQEVITPSTRPNVALFEYGTVVTTGFSGTMIKKPVVRVDAPEPDLTDPKYQFLNPNGEVATLLASDRIGFAYNGVELTRRPYDKILARDVGQVFGIAIDDEMFRNLYLTASSAFGLNIVGPDVDHDNVADRLILGDDDARWMPGQWGVGNHAGPGSIWKIDGRNGQISLFANVRFEEQKNTGPGLGNIAFDSGHKQLFVSDLQTGMIHRMDLDGRDIEQFDHGVLVRKNMDGKAAPIAYDVGAIMDISSADFDSENPETWGFAPVERRVWGMVVRGGRLYYAVAEGPSIYSVGLNKKTGAFLGDARWELTVEGAHSKNEISDMVFGGDGALIIAQRGARTGAFGHEKLTQARRAEVLRYVWEEPEDPKTPSMWVREPETYPVGFSASGSNAVGGVAVGPRYDAAGRWDAGTCGGALWTTGETLRDNRALKSQLQKGGELLIDGVQVQPVLMNPYGNIPPWQSYFSDYDGDYDGPRVSGHVGDVEVLGCRGIIGGAGDYATLGDVASNNGDPDTDPDPDGDPDLDPDGDPFCLMFPSLCFGQEPEACLTATSVMVCDSTTGDYVVSTSINDRFGNGLDRVKISDPSGGIGGLPVDQTIGSGFSASLSGMSPGQIVQLNLCGYRSGERASGNPYACCNAQVSVAVPNETCVKEAE